MKKIVVLLVVCLSAIQLFSQTLFTYGPYAVQKDEFLRAYNKNKTPVADKEQSLKEYLDLYSKFKLKVKAAQVQRLDTLQQLQYDLQNFRSQVAEGYMTDENGLNELVDEAIQRGQKDIHVLHFYIGINAKLSAADTLKAYKAMNELSDELKDGKQDYSAIVKEIKRRTPYQAANNAYLITGDATGRAGNVQSRVGSTAWTQVRDAFGVQWEQIATPTINPTHIDSRVICNSFISNFDEVFIAPHLRELIYDCEWVKATPEGDKKKENRTDLSQRADLLDALTYDICTFNGDWINTHR